MQLSYKLQVFAWLDIHQEIPSKAKLAKSGLFDDLCPIYQQPEIIKAYFLVVLVCQAVLEILEDRHTALFQNKIHRHANLFGNGHFLVRDSFSGLWHCLQISILFVLWKHKSKRVFDQNISSVSAFVSL